MSSGEFQSTGWFLTMFRGFFCIAIATNGADGLALGSESSVESESDEGEEGETETRVPKSEDAPCVTVACRSWVRRWVYHHPHPCQAGSGT